MQSELMNKRIYSTAPICERDFQASVIELAKLTGWRFYHVFDSRRSAAGYPDLTLVRGGRCIFAELKTDIGRVTRDQTAWLAALDAVPGIEAVVWRPRHWSTVEAILTNKAPECPEALN